jgi:hypothetical protein
MSTTSVKFEAMVDQLLSKSKSFYSYGSFLEKDENYQLTHPQAKITKFLISTVEKTKSDGFTYTGDTNPVQVYYGSSEKEIKSRKNSSIAFMTLKKARELWVNLCLMGYTPTYYTSGE